LLDIGRIEGLDQLAALASLDTIELMACYDFDAWAFPTAATWSALSRVDIDGLRKTDAALLRKRLASVHHLSIRGAKKRDMAQGQPAQPLPRLGRLQRPQVQGLQQGAARDRRARAR
jgi:hypothetical protein